MNIATLCDTIQLQPEIRSRVRAFEDAFDFDSVHGQLQDFRTYEKMNSACQELQTILGEDGDRIGMLACMLKASADVYEMYGEKGISDKIYFDTMKCYPRFIAETRRRTGRLYFDRYWWTARQAGGHLFRVGELEYEKKQGENGCVIEIHIPSDADFSPSAVGRSLESAKRFFADCFPGTQGAQYVCHSWLLDGSLREMLGEKSNILQFQKRFEILDEGEADTEFMQWVYDRYAADYRDLPEDTSLRRNMKKHLLSGGVIRSACGKIRDDFEIGT